MRAINIIICGVMLITLVLDLCNITSAKTIYVDDDSQADADNIQTGIDVAEYGDTVYVAPGTYYENITLKNGINLLGAGAYVTIIDANGYGDVVDAQANDVTICGFTLRNSGELDLGHMNCGVYIKGSYAPVIINNVIVNNNIAIGVWDGANPEIRNNIIKYNSNGFYIFCLEENPSNPSIINNTIVNNEANGIMLREKVSPIILNNIIMGHSTGINCNYVNGSPILSYNNLWNNEVNYMRNNIVDDTVTDSGSISIDPNFANPGYWTDVNNLDIVVEPNDPNAIWIDGDYHLMSEAGRWDPASQSWVQDNVTSPCIDTGDPNSLIGDEPIPNGGLINMGAYGGTAEASMSPGQPLSAYWTLDETEGGIAHDSAGNNDAAVYNAQWAEGRINGALDCNGLNTYMDCGSSETLGTEQMTISLWLGPQHMGRMRYIISRANLEETDYTLMRHYDGEIELAIGQADAEPVSVLSSATTPLNQWRHLAITLNGSLASIYINGQLDSCVTYATRVPGDGYNLTIASHQGSTRYYNGKLDEIRIYNIALSPGQIEELAQ